jgi:hypothetical protein
LFLTLDRNSANPGDPVKVMASFEGAKPPGAEYKFTFGDGQATAWSRRPEAVHQFEKAGAYNVQAFARVGTKEIASDPQIVSVPLPTVPTPWGKLITALLLVLVMAATAWRMFAKVKVRIRPAGPLVSHVQASSGLVQRPEIRLRVVLGEVDHHVSHTEETIVQR